MELINEYGTLFVVLTAIFGLKMAFGIGANDVSNARGNFCGVRAQLRLDRLFLSL